AGLIGFAAARDGLAGDGVPPGDDPAARVEAALDVVHVDRPVVTAAEVVLAGPDRLHRRAGGARDLDRLADEVLVARAAAPEAAAEEHGVERHVLGLDAEDLRGRRLIAGLRLGAGPDLAALAVDLDGSVERLHRRVGDVGSLVGRLDAARGLGERGR